MAEAPAPLYTSQLSEDSNPNAYPCHDLQELGDAMTKVCRASPFQRTEGETDHHPTTTNSQDTRQDNDGNLGTIEDSSVLQQEVHSRASPSQQSFESRGGIQSHSSSQGGVDSATARMIQLVETKSHTDITIYDNHIPESTTGTSKVKNDLYIMENDDLIGAEGADVPCTPLEQLVEAADRPTFQTFSSDTNLHDPCDPPSELLDLDTHELEDSSSKASTPNSIMAQTNMNEKDGESSSENTSSANSIGSKVYKITNTETGEIYDIRDLERIGSKESSSGFEVGYSLFPSKGDLIEMQSRRVMFDEAHSGNVKRSPIKETGKMISAKIRNSLRRGDEPSSNHSYDNETTHEENDNLNESQQEVKLEDTMETTTPLSPRSDRKEAAKATTRQRSKTNFTKSKSGRKKNAPVLLPPRNTLPVKSVNKPSSQSDFNPLLLISTITKAHDGPIWRSEFSKDGKYLATGGMDGVLNIWEVAPTSIVSHDMKEGQIDALWKGHVGKEATQEGKPPYDMHAPPLGTVNSPCPSLGTEVRILSSEPVQRFTDHTRDIVDISWSHSNFVLTASLDKYVRLWNPTRKVCLRMFHHADVVTAVSFHPNNDQYFLSGGFDRKIRIWSILDGRVKEWAQAPNIISTATFQPDGQYIAAGMFDGKVIFYSVDGIKLKYFTQINCKNRRAKHGKKVTGLSFLQNLSDDKVDDKTPAVSSPKGQKRKIHLQSASKFIKSFAQRKKKNVKQQLLVTTNDSRLRLVGLNDFCMVRKYKGLTNASLQIKARFSESGEFIICGSESRSACVWNTATKRNPLHVNVTGINMYDKVKNHESFEATRADPPIITDALFVPENSVKNAFLSSGLFPKLYSVDHINHDMTSAIIVTTDYEGTLRVFLRRACFDAICHASGPSGFK